MSGIRTAGDLVLRMQLSRGMKIDAAKTYVAGKLGVEPFDLSDCHIMRERRKTLDIGYQMPEPGAAKGIEAKIRIARLLGIEINAVERFKKRTDLDAPGDVPG